MRPDCAKISVVVVCYNEKDKIGCCIESLLGQTIGRDGFEIILVDNDSKDGTIEIIESYRAKDDRIKLIVNPVKGIAGSRNLGIRNAANDLIAYTDADCIAPENWLETMLAGFEKHYSKDKMLVAVGGANLPPREENKFYDAVGITLNTFLGNHGSTQGKIYLEDTYVDHIPTVNIMYRKDILLKYSGFDESFENICEDPELNHRLRKGGYKFVFLKESYVWHYMRADFKKWALNMFTYGKGRIWIIKKHIDHMRLMYMIPAVFVVSIFATPLGFWKWWFFVPLIYYPIIFVISFWECIKVNKAQLVFLVSSIYFINHFFYGVGEIYGLWKSRSGQSITRLRGL